MIGTGAARQTRSKLLKRDVLRLGTTGLRTRPARAVLSSLGIAIGIAAMVAVIGVSSSSQAGLDRELDALGTSLLTAQPGESIFGEDSKLPESAVAKVRRLDGVLRVSATGTQNDVYVYRSHRVDPSQTNGITVQSTDLGLLDVTSATIRHGRWFDQTLAKLPTVVLGEKAARRLGIVEAGSQVWLGGQYFTVVGILDPVALAPELNSAALVTHDVAKRLLGYGGEPTLVYEVSTDESVAAIRRLLGATIKPESPEEVEISRPSDALAARNAAGQAFTGLMVGIGSIALLVGGIGVANTMVISVLERRREIGLRRALGATRRHVSSQFLAEALLLSAMGGLAGAMLGALVTVGFAVTRGWPVDLPLMVPLGATGATLLIGALAGLYPAVRAARTPPTTALSG